MSAYRQNYTPTRTPRWADVIALVMCLAAVLAAAWLLRERPFDDAAAPSVSDATAYAAGQAAAREEMAASVAAAYAQGRADALREAGVQR